MLWIRNLVSTEGILLSLFLPSIVSIVVPTFLLQYALKGELSLPTSEAADDGDVIDEQRFSSGERTAVFVIGLSSLVFVPVFKLLIGLPPYMGALLALSVLWTTTEIFFRRGRNKHAFSKHRVASILSRIDMTTILFFLGILMMVATLQEIVALSSFGA